ncbi:hypothetical protein, partial [Deinococcus sp. 12RED42]|uniref:hypothetical protein n=1 Tax=Deinococcus sp. 12RED42 TaxID=2745872 RepID=UPI001E2C2C86
MKRILFPVVMTVSLLAPVSLAAAGSALGSASGSAAAAASAGVAVQASAVVLLDAQGRVVGTVNGAGQVV